MFWDDTPFESRARFMKDNVMEPSGDLFREYNPQKFPGFQAFRELLLNIYGKPEAFHGANDLERFHALSYSTQVFFYAVAQAGAIIEDGQALRVCKPDFKRIYKKPSNAPFETLPQFGIVFEYSKKGKTAPSYAACDAFVVRFAHGSGIADALGHMAKRFEEVDPKREYAETIVMLCKADYDRLILGPPAFRDEIDPLRADIVLSTGEGAPLYEEIIRRSNALGLNTSAYIQRYANPTWNVNFLRNRQLRLKTIWCEGRNFVHVPLPFANAQAVIRNRHAMPPRIREAIEGFGCVQCGRCKKSGTVKFFKIDDIVICTGHGESSTMFLGLESTEEIASIFDVIESLDR